MNSTRWMYRYGFALIGGFLAMSVFIFLSFNRQTAFASVLSQALGHGLIFGHLFAFAVIFAGEIPQIFKRLPRSIQAVIGLVGGTVWAFLAWSAYHLLFLLLPKLDLVVVGSAGFCLALSFALPLGWRDRQPKLFFVLLSILTTCLAVLLPILYFYQAWQTENAPIALLYLDTTRPLWWIIGLPLAFSLNLALWGHLPTFFLSSDSS